jgi:hypothetical protein
MTYYAATADEFPGMVEHYRLAASPAADSVSRAKREALLHYIAPRLAQLRVEIENLQEQQDAEMEAVDTETVRAAIAFANILPRSLPAPEITADPDGEISFDWLGPARKMFSASVRKDGRIAYAGWFGEKSKIHGIEQLSATLPAEIVRGIQKAVR